MDSCTNWQGPSRRLARSAGETWLPRAWECSSLSISTIGSSRTVVPRSLREYVELLFSRLETSNPDAALRIRDVTGTRRARIAVDAESVEVRFDRGRLRVTNSADDPVDGAGRTTRQATLDLMDGYLEVTSAVLDGLLELTGSTDAIVRMGVVLEILIDGATRAPALQQLARDFRDDPQYPSPAKRLAGPVERDTRFYSDPSSDRERRLLARLDLLP